MSVLDLATIKDAKRETGGGTTVAGGMVVSPETLAETGERYSSCTCENMGLAAGIPVADLNHLGAGCTSPHYVCPRLDLLRRRYA